MFTARALGDPRLLAAASWAELRKQLELQGSDPETLRAAQRVWSSYLAHVAKNRHSVAMSARQLLSDAQAPLAHAERGMNP